MKKSTSIILGMLAAVTLLATAQDMKVAGTTDYGKDKYLAFNSQTATTTVTNHTDEVTVYSVVIPAGTIGSNGVLRAYVLASANTLNSSNKQVVFRFGGTAVKRFVLNSATDVTVPFPFQISNRNNPAVQIGVAVGTAPLNPWTPFGQSLSTFAINSDVDQTFSIGVSNTLATDSINIDYFFVQVIRKP